MWPKRSAPLALAAVLLSACGSGASGTNTTTTRSASPAAAPPSTTVLPVVSCPTSYGAGNGSGPYVPRQLPAEGSVTGLSFYSNGLLTVLAPTGWTCGALVAADGGQRLDAYPAGQPDYSAQEAPPGAELVQLDVDYTGHGPGALLICPLFPGSPAVTFLQGAPPCPTRPSAETTTHLTDDIVAFRDPPGVKGTGAGSGGQLESSGDAVYPRVGTNEPSGGVSVAVLSCTLPSDLRTSCQTIETDFLIRRAPSYTGSG